MAEGPHRGDSGLLVTTEIPNPGSSGLSGGTTGNSVLSPHWFLGKHNIYASEKSVAFQAK